eukprot:gene10940-12162_t
MTQESKEVVPSFAQKLIDEPTHQKLKFLVAPHVESFDYFVEYGLDDAVADIPTMCIDLDENFSVKMEILRAELGYPTRFNQGLEVPITPREARESHTTYAGRLNASIRITVEGSMTNTVVLPVSLGELPVMVMSHRCQLRHLTPPKLVEMKEESAELGGYFVLRGIERVIRLLQVQRRNYAMAIERSNYRNRGTNYSDKGVAMRCVRKDQSSVTNTLHYLNSGGATLRFVLRKQEFLLPVVLVAKALFPLSDKELFDRIVAGDHANTFLTTRLELLLRDFKSFGLFTRSACLSYLGALFRGSMPNISNQMSDEEVGVFLIQRYIFIHVESFADKFEVLIHMLRKLFAFVQGDCAADNTDALMNHELLLPGHLIGIYVKEKIEEGLLAVKQQAFRDYRMNSVKFTSELTQNMNRLFQRYLDRSLNTLGQKIASFLSTGNIVTSTGMDLMQVSGYTIVAERLNYLRYLSHFQSVHRGQFFTTMKTTAVRKLLPESWGFLCPVHTPDGGPCGLLNHLAKDAIVLSYPPSLKSPSTSSGPLPRPAGISPAVLCSRRSIQQLLANYGLVAGGVNAGDGQPILNARSYLPVLLDGVPLGGVAMSQAPQLVAVLRQLKQNALLDTNSTIGGVTGYLEPSTEIAYVPHMRDLLEEEQSSSNVVRGAFPGLYLFTQPGRFIRPVYNLQLRGKEYIGPLEQVFLMVAVTPSEVQANAGYSHLELSAQTMLSQVASLTPYSDYNQSPRNMYQCQMGKQTMGTPTHALRTRTDNKLYRILNAQAPLVQTQFQSHYVMDEYPQGCNAVVAVISYTGYDMEDAMIISKSSWERGFGYGYVYKTKVIDLDEEEKRLASNTFKPRLRFSNIRLASAEVTLSSPTRAGGKGMTSQLAAENFCGELDSDGLPNEGVEIPPHSPLVCFVDEDTGSHHVVLHKEGETAYVETVRILGTSSSATLRKVSITLRYPRKPIIGDKFSSRHGQKGTLSVLWPQENMPFSETGMVPDVLINPHAFPSRMTIGMLIESMAGKSGALQGIFQDGTPFQFHEENRVVDHLGDQLRAAGYSYYGSEPLYNGLTGQVMKADIFLGVVFYQRLRHMVSDKSQVRSTGPVNAITRQPVKGRKKHGGIRLGEMERDALLSHGVAFCLQDRLMNCSDSHTAHVCAKCGHLLTVYQQPLAQSSASGTSSQHIATAGLRTPWRQTCALCKSSEDVRTLDLPYVFRYLANELAGMGVRLSLRLSD